MIIILNWFFQNLHLLFTGLDWQWSVRLGKKCYWSHNSTHPIIHFIQICTILIWYFLIWYLFLRFHVSKNIKKSIEVFISSAIEYQQEWHKNAACCFIQILEAEPYKTAAVQSLTSHVPNHPSQMNKTYWPLLGKYHKLIRDVFVWTPTYGH